MVVENLPGWQSIHPGMVVMPTLPGAQSWHSVIASFAVLPGSQISQSVTGSPSESTLPNAQGWHIAAVVSNSEKVPSAHAMRTASFQALNVAASSTDTADWPPGSYEMTVHRGDGVSGHQPGRCAHRVSGKAWDLTLQSLPVQHHHVMVMPAASDSVSKQVPAR